MIMRIKEILAFEKVSWIVIEFNEKKSQKYSVLHYSK